MTAMSGANLHVVHVIAGLGLGGAERMLANLVSADRPEAPRQTVINLLGAGAFGNAVKDSAVPLHTLNIRRPADALLGVRRLARLLRKLRPDVIQSWMYNADLLTYWAWRLGGLRQQSRLYWGVRCSDMNQGHYGRRLRWTVNACARRSHLPTGIVANSHAGAAVHQALGYSTGRMVVIDNGIDVDGFKPDPGARAQLRQAWGLSDAYPVVLHVARVDPMKDHALLLNAARERPDVQFVAAGLGTEHLDGPPNLLGLGARTDVASLYAAADLFLSTSAYGEGFPNVVGEAMASGLRTVATDVGDTARIVGDAGEISASGDLPGLLAAIDRQLAAPGDPDLPRKRIFRLYSLDRAVGRFDTLHRTGALPGGQSETEEAGSSCAV